MLTLNPQGSQFLPSHLLLILQASVALDTALQNSVMRMALHQGRTPAQLEAYLLRLRGMGLKPDAQTFNVLLRAYAARGDLQAATETLERMGAEGSNHSHCRDYVYAAACTIPSLLYVLFFLIVTI